MEEQPAVPKSEEELEREALMTSIEQTANESLESTRRMMAMCEESKEAGIKTLVMLDEQGEQLDRIEEGMDQINQDMKDAERKIWKVLRNAVDSACCHGKEQRISKKEQTTTRPGKLMTTAKSTPTDHRVVVGDPNGAMISGGYVTRVMNDAREDEMEQNMVEVSGMIGNLRNMAVDMGNEIVSQNRQLSRINDKGTSNEVRITEANKRATKLLTN